MIKIVICDSDIKTIAKYKTWLAYLEKKTKQTYNLQLFHTTSQLLAFFIRVSDLDILFIDPAIDNNSGISTVKRLRGLDCNAEIIYLDSSFSENQFADIFETEPLFYQQKNRITLDIFERILKRAIKKVLSKKFFSDIFSVRAGSVIKRIPSDSISYFEVSNRIVTVHYGSNQSFSFYSTISALEKKLNNSIFLRIHRSIIVNLLHVQTVNKGEVILISGESLPVGVTYSQLLVNTFSSLSLSRIL